MLLTNVFQDLPLAPVTPSNENCVQSDRKIKADVHMKTQLSTKQMAV